MIAAQERAGDTAREYHLYVDAAQYYRDALGVPAIESQDRLRISDKLANALFLGGDPKAADSLFDQTMTAYLGSATGAARAGDLLLQRSRELWLDARTEDALSLVVQALKVANTHGLHSLRKRAQSRLANHLIRLGRYREAIECLDSIGDVDESDDALIRGQYQIQRAIIATHFGKKKKAFDCFERAVNAASESPDAYFLVVAWTIYANCAMMLGSTELAKAYNERALLLARQFHILWYIPFACLHYAEALFRMGQYGTAHEYLIDALSYDVQAPINDIVFSEIGIPLSLYVKDDVALAKCARAGAIEFAFRSKEPNNIANAASVFAKWYAGRDREDEARLLLHRAMNALGDGDSLSTIWEFPITVAQLGLVTDVPKARRIIEIRARLPCADVAKASLQLFEAFVAKREGRNRRTREHAVNAAQAFAALGWQRYVDLANTLHPPTTMQLLSAPTRKGESLAGVAVGLTSREKQVAELVLKGLGNREIATSLSIKERTVEAHMTSIMGRLGVRSRHQLAEHFSQGQM